MICLTEINQNNWPEALKLQVTQEQLRYVADPAGILARGYAYRDCRAQVWGIQQDGALVGLAMVREFDEEPLGYELQQFLVDQSRQGQGVGTAALKLVLDRLQAEGRWPTVEVCVKKADAPALRVYEKAGFVDSGYVDPEVPDAVNLVCRLDGGQ